MKPKVIIARIMPAIAPEIIVIPRNCNVVKIHLPHGHESLQHVACHDDTRVTIYYRTLLDLGPCETIVPGRNLLQVSKTAFSQSKLLQQYQKYATPPPLVGLKLTSNCNYLLDYLKHWIVYPTDRV